MAVEIKITPLVDRLLSYVDKIFPTEWLKKEDLLAQALLSYFFSILSTLPACMPCYNNYSLYTLEGADEFFKFFFFFFSFSFSIFFRLWLSVLACYPRFHIYLALLRRVTQRAHVLY